MSEMDDFRASVVHYYRDVLNFPDWEERTARRLKRRFDANALARLERHGVAVSGSRVLDVGCGWGGFLYELASHAPTCAMGVEPDPERARIARRQAGDKRTLVIRAAGERLPLPSGFFDVVVCYEALEHTRDPEAVILAIMRVLRPGGIAHILTPNYLSFYEPHYKVIWFPLMPKAIGRLYLRIRGRDPEFINHIRYVNRVSLARCLNRNGIEYVDLALQNTIRRLNGILRRIVPPARISAVIKLAAQAYAAIMHREQQILMIKSGFG